MPDDPKKNLSFSWHPGDSRLQRRFLLGCHGLALAALALSALPLGLTVPLIMVLVVSAMSAWRRGGRARLSRLSYRDQHWELIGTDRQVRHGRLLNSTWLSRWLTLLHFRLENGRFLAVPVWCDSLDDRNYRQLQVVLRWYCR
ncbi:MAG TPA: hypothetical protein ENI90_08305 [Methylothermaceae bacterium]|nr:hypothetical protein [Methylothermaceae bacterium]